MQYAEVSGLSFGAYTRHSTDEGTVVPQVSLEGRGLLWISPELPMTRLNATNRVG